MADLLETERPGDKLYVDECGVKPGGFTHERTRQECSNSLFLTKGRTLVYWLLNMYVIWQDLCSGYPCGK
jgi:hypothetical protein